MESRSQNKFFDLLLFKKILRFVKPYRRTYYLVIVTAILLSFFSTASPYLLKITIDDYITVKDYDGMTLFIGLLVIALFLEVLFQFLFVFYANWLGQKVVKDLRVELFNKLMSFRMAYFDTSAVGRLVTRVVSDIETIASIFSQGLFMIIADLLKMGLIIILMLVVDWRLSVVVFLLFPIVVYATRLFQKAMKKAFEDVRVQVANLNTFVQERISGIKIVQLFHREKMEYQRFVKINERHKKAWLKTVWYNSFFFPVAEIVSSLTIGCLVWYGGLNVVSGGTITFGTIFLFIQLSQMLYRPLRHIADKFNTLQMGMVASSRIMKILDTDNRISNIGIIDKVELKGEIAFSQVEFSYIDGEKVLDGITLTISKGETVAIVGPTGSGKSTIINLITRFYENQVGSIKIDDIDIREFNLNFLRKNVAVVLQDVFLFADSLFNNITLFDDRYSKDDVIKAAKEIGVHEFIQSLPNDYDFEVRERGIMLSAGQRQLIAFLRAYILRPSILILDEATSSIDSVSEEIIQQATTSITKDKTSIIVAHRLATVRNADRIVVLDKGRIVENGTHQELMEIRNGHYARLYETQFSINFKEAI